MTTGTSHPPGPAVGAPAGTWMTLGVAIAAVAGSGPLMAAIAAPALAIAFWRNALAAGVLAPIATVRLIRLERLDRRTVGGCVLAGLLLAAHFGTWVPSLTLTSVATATALVCAQPVWAAALGRIMGRRLSRRFWLGIWLSVAGAVLLSGADLAVSGSALVGDALAVVGGALAAGYVTVGERVRSTTSTTVYTALCYGVCALVLLLVCLVFGVRIHGFDPRTWLMLAAVTIGPQFLGHSLLNRVLATLPATVVSVAILLEVPGAALLAFAFLGQRPPLLALPGIALLLAGLVVVVLAARPNREPEALTDA